LNVIVSKIVEVLYSVIPITLIVLILNFTLIPMEAVLMVRFIIGAVIIIIGLTIFLFGVDIGITPIGYAMGSAIIKPNKITVVIFSGIMLGFFISVAEPILHILAGQVDGVTAGLIPKSSIVVIVALGVAIMLAGGLTRIVYNFPLHKMLTVLYGIILILAFFVSSEFLAISFDASGSVTGALTVPFVLALAIGASKLKKDSKSSEEDSFGLLAVASTGAIITVMLMSIISKTGEITGALEGDGTLSDTVLGPFIQILPLVTGEVLTALSPMIIIFFMFQKISLKLYRAEVRRILFGFLFTFIGLIFFLVGVNAGFMEVGTTVGYELASLNSPLYVISFGFVLGMVIILAEPAVYVLTHQIEDVTSGYVKRRVVMVTLALGVAIAVTLYIIKILVPSIQLWHYLLPGYIIAIVMSYHVPKLFVGMAFDSGAVASGPMTATFILAFAQGVAEATEGANVLIDGFGAVAVVVMTPIIALQVLGIIFKINSKKEGVGEHEQQI
jgi:hypothetical protein